MDVSAPAAAFPPANRAKLWREPALANAEFLRAAYRSHCFPPHAHDEYAIGFIERGAQAFTQGRNQRLIMPQGKICVINPQQFHEGRAADDAGWDYRMLYIPPDVLVGVLGNTGTRLGLDAPFFAQSVIDDGATLAVLRAAHLGSESRDASRLEKGSRLVVALRQLVVRHAQFKRPDFLAAAMPRAVKRAREFIDAHVASNPALEEIAGAAGLSPFHLLRAFKATVGVPPHAYLVQRRVDRARRLLLQGRSLRSVAIDIGYSDQAHFSREFRRFYGVAPSTTVR